MMAELIGVSRNIARFKELIDQIINSEINTIAVWKTRVGKQLIVQNLYRISVPKGNN